jgi:hypothetical protein
MVFWREAGMYDEDDEVDAREAPCKGCIMVVTDMAE